MNPLFQLTIPRRQSQCSKGGEFLAPGMEYYSLLLDGEQIPERLDFCSACWHKHSYKDNIDSTHMYWQSRIENSKAASPSSAQTKRAKALNLLKEMLVKPDCAEAEIFVLALFLARGRQISLRREFKEKDSIYLLYEVPQEDVFLTVKKIDVSHVEILSIQQSISKKLNG